MIVCDTCGYPLYGTGRPQRCPCQRCQRDGDAVWIEYEDYIAKEDAERAARDAEEDAAIRRATASKKSKLDFPSMVGDRLKRPYFDYALGQEVTHKSQVRKLIKDKGLQAVSLSEHYRDQKKPHKSSVTSYAGQGRHTHSARNDGVRTATGQRIV